ncbi:MAG: preprotein translocase subunit SecG [Alphaproteobacteria bacterium]|nr:preprotein translocase subunit SecG [Alphaproteobacteria bacterium]
MSSVILTIHIMLAVAITILVLLQRSEGGALGGLGGGQGANGLFTGRQAGNILTKLTSIFFACFVVTSLSLVIMARNSSNATPETILPPVSSEQK